MRENSVIQAVKKDKKGVITHFMMSNGQVFDYATALRMAETGQLANVEVKEQNGHKYLHNTSGNNKYSNLEDFPLFD